jgi:tetratricopeptide (TPR) repeat protein
MSPATERAIPTGGDKSGALILINIGIACYERGNSSEALASFSRAVVLAYAAYGMDHAIMACCLCLYGKTLSDIGELNLAETVLRHALRVRECSLPAGDPDIAVTLHNLAACILKKKAYEESVNLFRRARDIETQAFGATHESTLFTRLSLVTALDVGGRVDEAERELAAVSSVLTRHFRATGKRHPLVPRRDAIREEMRNSRVDAFAITIRRPK